MWQHGFLNDSSQHFWNLQNEKNETVTIKAVPMENLEFESSLTIGEIEENFKDVDCFSGIMKGLQEAMAHSREKAAADDQSTKVK